MLWYWRNRHGITITNTNAIVFVLDVEGLDVNELGQHVDCSTYEDSEADEVGGKRSSDFGATDERDVHDQKHDAVYTQIYAVRYL